MRLIVTFSIFITQNLFAGEKKDLIRCEGETTHYSFRFKTKEKRVAIAGANSIAGSCNYSTLRKPEVIQQMPKAIQSIASEKHDQNISAGECWQILSLLQIGGARCCFENTDGHFFEDGQPICEKKSKEEKPESVFNNNPKNEGNTYSKIPRQDFRKENELPPEDISSVLCDDLKSNDGQVDYRALGGYFYTSDFEGNGKQRIKEKEFCRKSETLLCFKKFCSSVDSGVYFCEAPSEKYFLYLFEDEKSCRSQLAKKKSGYRAPEVPALLRRRR